jgi:hypothetical protein
MKFAYDAFGIAVEPPLSKYSTSHFECPDAIPKYLRLVLLDRLKILGEDTDAAPFEALAEGAVDVVVVVVEVVEVEFTPEV